MHLTQQELQSKLGFLGIPMWQWQLADAQFATVSAEYVAAVWAAWIDSLRANAPELLDVRQIGGGKSRSVPRWVSEAGDCENHSVGMIAHAMVGNWLAGVQRGELVGRAFGVLFYTAQPRAENRGRAGGHAIVWFVDHAGAFRTFEPGDGDECTLTHAEISSANFGFAA